ncbi:hypothetical protein DPMN_176368 [Dreissena polymorpha]|uniref:Purple acid phosphatase C-terminal domain-containing protein n=2 Tax=Dreissena polymorpha TaxID=45954 RepID=A0A9D4E8Y6_DREPO|nr:hypothetical protein DPMN_176368 [Dreissena polymorpha]
MYKGVVLAENYTNPRAPIQLITGSAGSKHGVDTMMALNAFRMDGKALNSYSRLKVYNATTLYWEQVAVFGGAVLDSIWVTQESHGSFSSSAFQGEQKVKIDEQIKVDEQNLEKHNLRQKPETTGDAFKVKVSKVIQGADIKVIIGVSFAVFILVFLLVVCIVRACSGQRTNSNCGM